jgi:hypothetical protein
VPARLVGFARVNLGSKWLPNGFFWVLNGLKWVPNGFVVDGAEANCSMKSGIIWVRLEKMQFF